MKYRVLFPFFLNNRDLDAKFGMSGSFGEVEHYMSMSCMAFNQWKTRTDASEFEVPVHFYVEDIMLDRIAPFLDAGLVDVSNDVITYSLHNLAGSDERWAYFGQLGAPMLDDRFSDVDRLIVCNGDFLRFGRPFPFFECLGRLPPEYELSMGSWASFRATNSHIRWLDNVLDAFHYRSGERLTNFTAIGHNLDIRGWGGHGPLDVQARLDALDCDWFFEMPACDVPYTNHGMYIFPARGAWAGHAEFFGFARQWLTTIGNDEVLGQIYGLKYGHKPFGLNERKLFPEAHSWGPDLKEMDYSVSGESLTTHKMPAALDVRERGDFHGVQKGKPQLQTVVLPAVDGLRADAPEPERSVVLVPFYGHMSHEYKHHNIAHLAAFNRHAWLVHSDMAAAGVGFKLYVEDGIREMALRILGKYGFGESDCLFFDSRKVNPFFMSRPTSFGGKCAFFNDPQFAKYDWVFQVDADCFLASGCGGVYPFFRQFFDKAHPVIHGLDVHWGEFDPVWIQCHPDHELGKEGWLESASELGVHTGIYERGLEVPRVNGGLYALPAARYHRECPSRLHWLETAGEMLQNDEAVVSLFDSHFGPVHSVEEVMGLPFLTEQGGDGCGHYIYHAWSARTLPGFLEHIGVEDV